jgi:hypothetical protein
MSVSISVELLNDPPPLLPPQVNLVVFFEIEDNFNSDAINELILMLKLVANSEMKYHPTLAKQQQRSMLLFSWRH